MHTPPTTAVTAESTNLTFVTQPYFNLLARLTVHNQKYAVIMHMLTIRLSRHQSTDLHGTAMQPLISAASGNSFVAGRTTCCTHTHTAHWDSGLCHLTLHKSNHPMGCEAQLA